MSDGDGVVFEVSMGKGRYACLRPQITARFPAEARLRVARATVLRLAAEVELATPEHESWCVSIEEARDPDRLWYRVVIETGDGTPAEAARAITVLERVAVRR